MTTTIDTLLSATKTLLSAAWKLFLVHVLCFLLLVWFESTFTLTVLFIGYVIGWAVVISKTQQKKLLWFYLAYWVLFHWIPNIPSIGSLINSFDLRHALYFFRMPFISVFTCSPYSIVLFFYLASIIVLPLLCVTKLIYLTRKQRNQPPQQGQDT